MLDYLYLLWLTYLFICGHAIRRWSPMGSMQLIVMPRTHWPFWMGSPHLLADRQPSLDREGPGLPRVTSFGNCGCLHPNTDTVGWRSTSLTLLMLFVVGFSWSGHCDTQHATHASKTGISSRQIFFVKNHEGFILIPTQNYLLYFSFIFRLSV